MSFKPAFPPQDPRRKRLGSNMLAIFGTVFTIGGFIWFLSSGMPARDAIMSLLPLAILFGLFAWAVRDSMDRVFQLVYVLALVVTVAGVVLAAVIGK